MWAEKKRTSSPAWKSLSLHVTGQIVFVPESFGSKATSEHLLLILHMALQLLYQNFVPLTNGYALPATKAKNAPSQKFA